MSNSDNLVTSRGINLIPRKIVMKNSFRKILTVLSFGLLLNPGADAQDPAVSVFPYVSDFGTVETPGPDNGNWRFRSFDVDEEPINALQWGFSEISETLLAVCFTDTRAEEQYPATFTPAFRLEKADNISYIVNVAYSVPAGASPSRHLIVRLHATDESGEPYYVFGPYQKDESIKDADGNVCSVLINNHQGVPREGVSEYVYRISSDMIPRSGDYRISFILEVPSKNTKAGERLYITALNVKKSVGSDLAAGQIISPYTDPHAESQAFSAFVINQGSDRVESFDACYQVDGGVAVKETFSDIHIDPDHIARIVFKTLPDLQAGNHTLRFWLEKEGDMNHENDTSYCLIRAGSSAVATLPATYGFTEDKPYEWTTYSDSSYIETAWRFVKDGNYNRPYVSTDKQDGKKNDDYLVSPLFNFRKGNIYRVEFIYKAVLEAGDAMGDKSLDLYVCDDAGRESLAGKELIWKKDRFDDRGERRVVVYYRAKEDGSRALAFHVYGPASDGGLQLRQVLVSLAEENTLDYFFDFDGNAGESPQYLVGQNLDFVDYDGNVSNAGTPGNWELYGEGSGFNSMYSVRSIGLRGKTDDWMVFRPFYLESGKTYYLSFRTRMNSTYSGSLEYYVQNDGPRYDLAYEAQGGVKGRKMVSGNSYDTVHRVFTVNESGYYLLSIRNFMEIAEQTDLERYENFTVHVDNVSLSAKERTSVQAMYADVPYEARFGQTVSLSMTVRNFSLSQVEAGSMTYCYQIDNGDVCREHPASSLLSQVRSSYTFNQRAAFNRENTQTVKFWVEMEASDEDPDTVYVDVVKIQAKDLPFVERFAEKSMEEWQSYPVSRNSWQMRFGSETAHSGEWAAICNAGTSGVSDFLVTPLLTVEKGKTYRVSFFYRRGGDNIGATDSLRLCYAYNRYDNTGFLHQLTVFPKPNSSEYDFCQAYVRFPDSGVVFLGLKAELGGNASPLYIDDFVLVDSLQTTLTYYSVSGLAVSGSMSECDTMAMGRVSFKITAGGFSMPEEVRTYISYDGGPAKDLSFRKEMMDGEETVLSLSMPMFSGGEHRVRVWIGLPDEADRTDDTVSAVFNVHQPQTIPFVDSDIRIVGTARMTSCFEVETAAVYTLRYRYDATEAVGSSVQLNLLSYGNNSITGSRMIDRNQVSGKQTLEKEVEINDPGVYAFGIECSGLSVGGILRVDSIWLEKKSGSDTTATATFADGEFRMQPNPALDFVDITVPTQAKYLDIFDMQGRVCRRFVLQDREMLRISLQDFRPGVYVVRVSGANRAATLKLIKR